MWFYDKQLLMILTKYCNVSIFLVAIWKWLFLSKCNFSVIGNLFNKASCAILLVNVQVHIVSTLSLIVGDK